MKGDAKDLIAFMTQQIKYLDINVKEVDVKHLAHSVYCEPKQCFNNTYRYMSAEIDGDLDNLSYVLGYVVIYGVPIEHAWVLDNNKHEYLDLTLDPAEQERYFSVVELSYERVNMYVDKFGHAPDLYAMNRFMGSIKASK